MIKEDLKSYINGLYIKALEVQDYYWKERITYNKQAKSNNTILLGCYIRIHKDSIEIHWKKSNPSFITNKSKKFTEHIRKGRKSFYTEHTISRHSRSEFEYELVMKCEKVFGKIRSAQTLNKKMQRDVEKLETMILDLDMKLISGNSQ